MFPKKPETSFLVALFFLLASIPQFGTVSHEHAGGEEPHVHSYLPLFPGAGHDHPKPHRDLSSHGYFGKHSHFRLPIFNSAQEDHDHLQPHGLPLKDPLGISSFHASALHTHHVDKSIGAYLAVLVLLPVQVAAVLPWTFSPVLPPSRRIRGTQARAPPRPLAL